MPAVACRWIGSVPLLAVLGLDARMCLVEPVSCFCLGPTD